MNEIPEHLINTLSNAFAAFFLVSIFIVTVIAVHLIECRLRRIHNSMNSRLDAILDATRSLSNHEDYCNGCIGNDKLQNLRKAGSKLKD